MGGLFGGGGTISNTEPMLGAMRIQTSAFGYPLPIVYGTTRITANLIWYGDFQAIPHTTTQSSGGKGGGGVESSNTSYTYQTAVAMGLCEGPIAGIGTVWASKDITSMSELGMTLFSGAYPQSPWGYLVTYHPVQAIGYQGLAYVAAGSYQLGSGAALPNHSFELAGKLLYGSGIVDANPRDIVVDFLTNANYGACSSGFPFADLTQYSNYCIANDLFISPAFMEQRPASEHLADILRASNSAPVHSEGVLKIIPYGDTAVTAHGVTYNPSITPIYDLTDDDFLDHDEPVRVSRKTNADAFNQVQIEFLNRANQYNVETAEVKDQFNIEQFGLRPNNPIKMHSICSAATANKVAQMVLQRELYIRNEYFFKLGWRYGRLEPMDVVTLTDPGMNLDKYQVRITSIEEDEDGGLDVVAEEFPFGVAHPALYSYETAGGYNVNYNASPGNTNTPDIFEAPYALTGGMELWLAASGGAAWGGCEVWASADDTTYKRIGYMHGPSRYGIVSAMLANHVDPDPAGSFGVDLTASSGVLTSGTQADADANRTALYVGGEIISFVTATLTAAFKYTISNLRRGQFRTVYSAHLPGEKVIRLDDAIFKSAITEDMIGKPLFLKLPAFNQYGGGLQALSAVSPIQFNITGAALTSPLPDVTHLTTTYKDGIISLSWRGVVDDRLLGYEVRKGLAFTTAEVIGTTVSLESLTRGDGTYWVTAKGASAYSANPASVVVTGSAIPVNVVSTVDELATNWGSFTVTNVTNYGTYLQFFVAGAAGVAVGDGVTLAGLGGMPGLTGHWTVSNDIAPDATHFTIAVTTAEVFTGGGTWRKDGIQSGVSANGVNELVTALGVAGTYTIPVAHEVDITTQNYCNVSVGYTFRTDNPAALFSAVPLVSALSSFMGNYAGQATCDIQIAIAPNSGIYGAWQDFVPGQYLGRKFKFRAVLTPLNASVIGVLSGLNFTVDMPDKILDGIGLAVPAGGAAVVFATPFIGGQGGGNTPNIQVTIVGAVQGDTAVVTAPLKTGFTVQVFNGGVGVARAVNWLAKGY